MTPLLILIYLLLAASGTIGVLVRRPLPQSIVLGIYGMLLGILLLALQAPDVALSEIVIGSATFPLLILLAIAKTGGKGVE